MTREEEIQKLIDEEMGIDNYGSSDYQVGLSDGVRLADKTMIDKACEWLKDELYDIEDYTQPGGIDIRSKCYFTSEDLIEHFKKAMQNE